MAFANLWQAPAGAELSVDLMRHVNEAPKGTMDFLFIELFLWGRAQGLCAVLSLGMAPLSGLAQHRLAGRWNRLAGLLARHGERFYGFSGLRRFKSKFDPQWRPRYLAAPGGMHLPAALLDATRLISGSAAELKPRCVGHGSTLPLLGRCRPWSTRQRQHADGRGPALPRLILVGANRWFARSATPLRITSASRS